MRSASKMPAPIIESPRTRRTKSPSSRRRKPGTSTKLLDVLVGEDGRAGGDAADQRQRPRRPQVADHVQRARLGRVALDEPEALEVGEMRVDGRRRGQLERRADLAHRRRIAVDADALADELQYLLLSRGETFHRSSSCGEHVFVSSVERTRVRVKADDRQAVGRKNVHRAPRCRRRPAAGRARGAATRGWRRPSASRQPRRLRRDVVSRYYLVWGPSGSTTRP